MWRWIRRCVLAALVVVVTVSLALVLWPQVGGWLAVTDAPQAVAATPGPAFPGDTLFGQAATAELICHAEILRVERDDAWVRVGKVLKGERPAGEIKVSLIVGDVIRPDYERQLVGQGMVLFLKRTPEGDWRVGTMAPLSRDTRREGLQAVDRALAIAAIEDEEARTKAILAEAASANQRLRWEARAYIQIDLAYDPDPQRFRDEIAALFGSNDEEVRLVGLEGLRHVRVDDLLPELIELTDDPEDGVAVRAAQALALYERPETISALVAMSRHPTPHRRDYAVRALGKSDSPGAVHAVMQRLDDPSSGVRESALRRFTAWFQRGIATDAVPAVIARLEDPDPFVQSQAATALGHCGQDEAIQPLMNLVRSEAGDLQLRMSAVGALGDLYPALGPAGKSAVEADLDLIVGIVDVGPQSMASGAVRLLSKMEHADAVATLRRAAKTHPDDKTRRAAQHALRVKGLE